MDQFNSLLAYLKDPETAFGLMDPFYAFYLIYGLVRGLFRGLPEELAQLVGTVLVVMGAHFFYRPVSALMIEHTQLDSEEASLALAYLLMVLLFFIVWRLITLLIKKALDWTCPKSLHRPGGALLGLAKCALILSILLTAIQLSGHSLLTDHLITRSWLGRRMENVIPERARKYLPEWIPQPAGTPEAPSGDEDGSGDA